MKRINKTEEYMLYYDQFLALQEQGRLKEGSIYHILDLPDGLDLVEGKWTVKKAEQDAKGNIIHETYVKRLDLDYKIVNTLPVDTSMGKMVYLDNQIEPVIYNTADMIQVEDNNVTMNVSSQEFWDSITNGIYVDGLKYYTEVEEGGSRRLYEVYLYVTNVDNLGEYESVNLKFKTNLWERNLNLSFVSKENNVISYALAEEGSRNQWELTFLVDNNVLFTRLLLITDQINLVEYFQLENVTTNTGDILYLNVGGSKFNLSNLKISNGNEYASFIPTKTSNLENDTHFVTEEYVKQNGGKIDKILLNNEEQAIVDKAVNLTINKTTVGLSNVDNTSDLNKPISTQTQTALDGLNQTITNNFNTLNSSIENETERATLAETEISTKLQQEMNTRVQEHAEIQGKISAINSKIPNQASSTNQLADKDFVNSTINSSAAFFKGSFKSKAALDAVQWQTTDSSLENYVTNNDYAYVEADETHNNEAWRYIYVKDNTVSEWQPQFRVNESPFTQAQLDAINSGATTDLINSIGSKLTQDAIVDSTGDSSTKAISQRAATLGINSVQSNLNTHILDKNNPHQVTKTQIGLENVDNTSDLDKPISTAVSTEFAKYLPLTAGSDKPLTDVLVTAGGADKIWDKNSGIKFGGNSYISGDTTSLGLQSSDGVYFRIADTTRAYLGSTTFRPSISNGLSIGSDTYRFSSIHGTEIYQDGKQVANAENLSAVTDATLSSDSKTLTVTKRDGTSFDFKGGSDITSIDGLAGGNLTSNVGVNNKAKITTEGYVVGTWLQATNTTDIGNPNWTDVWVNHNGWLYKRNKSDFVNDLGFNNYVPITRTINDKALSSNISLNSKDVGALPDYTITISHQTAGNPRIVKFVSVNYASAATCFKMGAMTCHYNGVSYQFLTDMLIAVTTDGVVTANIYKFAQSSIGNVDGVARYTGDVFYVNDTTNKIVDFYILCGQYSASQFTPVTKVGSTTIDYVTQHSGDANYYSSGDKMWVNGCGTTYARLSDIPTNYVTTDTTQTITGKKTFSTNGLTVSGRVLGSGDDEGIVVSPASNNYAGICLGDPNGKRAVLYLRADGTSVWRYNNGSTSYDLTHPQKAGTIALTSDIPSGIITESIAYREFATLLPKKGTMINNGADLNSIEYLKVGNYYQSASANTNNMTNIPQKEAFMMTVYAPLSSTYDDESTNIWCYRTRCFMALSGDRWWQFCYTSGTAGVWSYGPWHREIHGNGGEITGTLTISGSINLIV